MNEPRTERTVKTTTSSPKRRRLCRSPSPHSLLRGDEEPRRRKEEKNRKKYRRQLKNVKKTTTAQSCAWTSAGAFTRGNAKLEYASTSSILFSVSSSVDEIRHQNQGGLLKKLLRDCKKVFTAKQTLETESYSAGSTFWISAAAEPKQMVQQKKRIATTTRTTRRSLLKIIIVIWVGKTGAASLQARDATSQGGLRLRLETRLVPSGGRK